jgi:ParB family chromosome partitioning protein
MYQSDPTQSSTLEIHKVKTELRQIPVDLCHSGMWQQRKTFNEQQMQELAASMKIAGENVTPIVLTPDPSGGYSIISGERRWRAAQINRFEYVKALVGKYSFSQAAFIAAAENLQRADLNPIEEASSFYTMKQQANLSDEQIAAEFGKTRSHVSNYIRLLSLDIKVRDALIRGVLTFSQARPLCTLEHLFQQRDIAEMAIKHEWSNKAISEAVNKVLTKPKVSVKKTKTDADIASLERTISEKTGYPCRVKKTPAGHWLVSFLPGADDQFMGLLEQLGIKTDFDLGN